MCDRYGIGVLSRRWGEVQMVNFKVVLKTEFRFVSHTWAGGMKVGGIREGEVCVGPRGRIYRYRARSSTPSAWQVAVFVR